MDDVITLPANFYGYTTLHETIRFEGGKTFLGGYSREWDRDGNLIRESARMDYVILEYL